MSAGIVAGMIAAASTNALEVITVTKQTRPDTKIKELVRREGFRLIYKGLAARVCLNGLQCVLLFQMVHQLSTVFGV